MHAAGTEKLEDDEEGPAHWRSMIVSASAAMRNVLDLIAIIAGRRTTVLITGETGSGKEVAARAIHAASSRSGAPFVAVNCAAIAKDLLEAELFGRVEGALAYAAPARMGLLEQAEGGTLLLDEIGDLALELQSKLLRILQEREFQLVGSSETMRLDVRFLAATNVDLLARVKQGRFREDLYYRLHVVPLRVPPLRERREDILPLAEHFIQSIAQREGCEPKILGSDALALLVAHSWPGNVRELENTLEMAMIVSGSCSVLAASDLSLTQENRTEPIEMTDDQLLKLPEEGIDFEAVIARIELNLLEQALRRTKGNKRIAADMLKLKRTTLAAKLKSLEEAFPALATIDTTAAS